MKAFRTAMALIGVACASAAQAEVAVWTNVATAAAMEWGHPQNWTDAGGEVLTVAPTSSTCEVRFPSLPLDNNYGTDAQRRTVSTGGLSSIPGGSDFLYPAVNPDIASIGPAENVWDTWRWTINFATHTSQYHQPNFRHLFRVANPDAFDGYWQTGTGQAVFELPATAGHVPTMSSLSAKCRPYVKVPDEGTTAAVQSIHEAGTVSKQGAGELRVGATLGRETRFTVEAGTLTLEGSNDDELEALLKTAALRLDATRTDTLVTYSKTTEGVEYTCVSNWYDANGNGVRAYQEKYVSSSYWYPYSHGAFISPAKSPTDLPLVDFGSRTAQNGAYGPSNCWLILSKTISDPRAVFYAVQTPGGAAGCTILGDTGDVMGFVSEGGLFCNYGAGRIGRTGDIMLNGEPKTYSQINNIRTTELKNLNVISVATQPGAKVALLGSDRHYVSRSGGSRIGELLIFTNELTRVQRVRVAQYLTRKWVTGETDVPDANAVIVNAATNAVGVPEGRTAKVEELRMADGVLTKKGGGTLEIGHMEPPNATICVEGGAVTFGAGKTIPNDAPAADPYIWLDAEDAATRMTQETFDGYGETYVSAWRDHRDGTDLTAYAISNTPPRMPFLVNDMGNGRKGVSLGKGTSNTAKKTQSWFALPTWGAECGHYAGTSAVGSDTYAGFIVCRFNVDNNGYNIFGSSGMSMLRTSGRLISPYYVNQYLPSAFWSINGVAADPVAYYADYLRQTNDLVLLAFRSPVAVTLNAIAKDRKDPKDYTFNCGNLTVCEFITYHRQLTEDEYLATEAYLLKKWMDADHPATVQHTAVYTMKVEDGDPVTIGTDEQLDVARVEGGSSVVKTGTGSATMSATADTAAGGVTVEEGALKADFSLATRALFHFDAAVSNSFTTYEGEDGKTYVKCWRDVSTNGIYGCSLHLNPSYTTAYAGFVMTNPTLARVTMPDGVERTVVDFGGYRNTATQQPASEDASSIYFARTMYASGYPSAVTNVREIYVVYKINHRLHNNAAQPGAHIIGNLSGGAPAAATSTIYMRGGSTAFSTSYTSHYVQEGYLATNRVAITAGTRLTEDWQLMSVGATGYTRVDSIMQDRNCNAGGACVAEMIAFDFELTAAERAALEQHLMRKWGIGSEAAPTLPTDSVNVAAGASLDVGDCTLTTDTLSGGGTLTATAVALASGADLSFTYRSAADVDHLTVNGPLSLAGGVTVHVAVAESAVVEEGEWPLLSATGGITGLDLASVTFDSGFAATRWVANLFVRDGALWLRVQPKGTIILLR